MADTSSDGKTYLDMSTYYKFLFCSAIIFFICFIRRLSCLFLDNRGIFPSHRETDARTQTSRPSPHLFGRRNAVNVMEGKREKERASCLCRSELYRLVFLLSFHRHCEKDIRERDSLTVEQKEGVRTRVHTYIYRVCSYIYIYPIDSLVEQARREDAYAGRRRERSCCRCCWRSRAATNEDGLGIERARDSKGGVGGWKQGEEEGVCVSLRREKERIGEEWMRERRGGRALATRTKGEIKRRKRRWN